MTTWTNMSSDPSSDERVLRDAQKTIEKVVEAARVALDDELAVQQMEYDQVYGLNSMQFAMYQTLVMTFFQDHQMLASLNLKRSQRDLSPGVNESKRAQLMEVIAQRVSTGTQPVAPSSQAPASQGQSGSWANGGASQSPPPPAWGVPGGAPVPTNNANWLDKPVAQDKAEPSAGDWLSKPGTPERPPSSAWPTSGDGSADGPAWTVKPGGGGLPPVPSESNGSWSNAPSGWPSDKSKSGESAWPQPAAAPAQPQAANTPNQTTDSPWPAPSQASSWPEQPGANKQLPPAAWPASNSGSAPKQPEAPAPPASPPGGVRPSWGAPIGESGQSGTWTLDSKPAAPPAAAWTSPNAPETLANNWNTPQQAAAPAQAQAQVSQSVSSSAPAWAEQPVPQGSWTSSSNSGELPQPAWQSNLGQNAAPPANQPWQAPTANSPAPQWQSGPNPVPAPSQPAAPSWPQQNPSVIAPSAVPAQPPQPAWQAPAGVPPQPAWQSPPASPQPQPWQSGAPNTPPQQQAQPAPQPWTPPGVPSAGPGAQPWTPPGPPTMFPGNNGTSGANGVAQPGSNGLPPAGSNGSTPTAAWQTGTGMTPPAMPQPQPAYQTQQAQYPTGQDFQNPTQYQTQYTLQDPTQQQAYQQQQQPSANTEDMSISFSQQPPQGQNGATLGGVLRQMRNFDNTRKREDEQPPESYNPNNAW